MIEVSELTKDYGTVVAVRGVSFDVDATDFVDLARKMGA